MSRTGMFVFSAVAAVSAIATTSCSRSAKIEAATKDPGRPVIVPAVKALPADLSRELVLSAEFKPYQEIDLHAKVAGYLKSISVDVGDHVRAGQQLAVLEIPEMADDLTRAEAACKRSEAELTRAHEELRRSESSHTITHLSYTRLAAVMKERPGLVAQQEIDDALARDRMSEAQVSAAKAALTAAEQQVQVTRADAEKTKTLFGYSRITAPFTGVISRRYADTGAMIQAGTASQSQAMPIVRLSQNGLLRLVLPVPESVVPRIHIGAPVEVRVPTLKRSFVGKIARFSQTLQFSTRTMETEVDVPNPSLLLMPGMFAEAILTLDRRDDVLAVPVQALSGHDVNPTVLIIDGQKRLKEVPVRLGLETPNRVEVLSGLQKGDLVVVGSRSRYRAGELVEPKLVHLAELKGE